MLDINRATIDIPSESLNFSSGQIIGGYTIDKLLFEGSQSQLFSIKNDNTKIIKVYFISEEPSKETIPNPLYWQVVASLDWSWQKTCESWGWMSPLSSVQNSL